MQPILRTFVSAALLATAAAACVHAASGPELIPGAHLMTSAEREHYRNRMDAAQTAGEKGRLRAHHLDVMDRRARNFGLTLNREPVGKRDGAEATRGSQLHDVCFSCHGSERYQLARQKVESFLNASLATAGGIDEAVPATSNEMASALPPGVPRMSRSQVKNLAGLKKAIARWNDYFYPKLTAAEVDNLAAYLNAAYYKF